MTLVGIHDQRVKIRKVLLCNQIRKRLEAVRAQIQVLQVPEVLEVRMEACKAICTDGKSLEVRELGDMLTCIKAAEEVVGVRVDHYLLCRSKILDLIWDLLLCIEHEELHIPYSSLVRAIFPYPHIVPMFHSFSSIPFHITVETTAHCKKSKRVTSRCIGRNRQGCLLDDLYALIPGQCHIFLWKELYISYSLRIARIDFPVETYLSLSRTCSAIEVKIRLLI